MGVAAFAGADFHRVEIGTEVAAGFAGDFRTDTTQIFGLAARFDLVPFLNAFSTNFTSASHCTGP